MELRDDANVDVPRSAFVRRRVRPLETEASLGVRRTEPLVERV